MTSPKRTRSSSVPHSATKPAAAKPKRGRPFGITRPVPRCRTLPRVSEATHARLTAYATARGCFLADAIEAAAALLPAP